MELETLVPPPTPPSRAQRVFFNERGLRAGWRLLIFSGMLVLIFQGVTLAGRFLQELGRRSGAPAPSTPPQTLALPIGQGIFELIGFLIVLFLSWIMSRIERRNVGAYGLPLNRSAFTRFITGYIFWGFLPLTVLLLVMRALHGFYFGSLALHGGEIIIWGLAWAFAFVMVGFQEEFVFRGYSLYTLADGIGYWPAAVIMALIFAYAHMGNGGENRIGILAVIAFALFASAILLRTGNLWLAVGAHAGWDWGESFFYGVNDSGFQAPGHLLNPAPAHAPVWLTGGTVGPEGSVLTLILFLLLAIAVLAIYRRRPTPAPSVITELPAAGYPTSL